MKINGLTANNFHAANFVFKNSKKLMVHSPSTHFVNRHAICQKEEEEEDGTLKLISQIKGTKILIVKKALCFI